MDSPGFDVLLSGLYLRVGSTWQVTSLPAKTVAAGGYFLVQESQGSGGSQALPTPDATGTIAMSGTDGKVAVVNSTTALSGAMLGDRAEATMATPGSSFKGVAARLGHAEMVRRVPETGPMTDADTSDPAHPPELEIDLAEHQVFRPAAPRAYEVRRLDDGSFKVTGAGVERLLARYDLDNEEAMVHLERRLRGIGVLSALEAQGFTAGDEVEIAGVAFDYGRLVANWVSGGYRRDPH